mgnify:CR=1 FL=1
MTGEFCYSVSQISGIILGLFITFIIGGLIGFKLGKRGVEVK